MFTVERMQVTYNHKKALDITEPLTFQEGEKIGIIGANGAGKSTFIKSCLGLTAYQGSVISGIKTDRMAVHMQSNHYTNSMSVQSIMELVSNTKVKTNQKLQELITFFDFEDSLKKKVKALSGGQKQRLTLIMVLLQDAPLTFFDEVTTGLDFETRNQLVQMLNEWFRHKKSTICLVSHYFEELEQLVDKILIFHEGRVVDFDSREALFHKYCGKAVIILDNNLENSDLTKEFPAISSPEHLIVLKCENGEIENAIISRLVQKDINFRRSNNDIEIMYINALAAMKGGEDEREIIS